jgi:DNA-binding NtrC family response regulator
MAEGRATSVSEKRSGEGLACLVPSAPEAVASPARDPDLAFRLSRLRADHLIDILIELVERQGEPLRRALDEALQKIPDTLAPSHAEDSEPYMVGSSPAMQRVYGSIRKFAATDAAVLISGESGTGKELVARAIHERSAYRGGPFVAINCAALPATLIAAELFGHETGASSGAMQRRIGRLESADGGTIFLDEIGDLPLEPQAHLLRFLQERTIDQVGGTRPITVDARIICATSIDLARAIRDGRLREDLYYRLHVLNLLLPSLRERGGDIDLLATFFLRKFAAEQGRDIEGFGDDAWQRMRAHPWPGNVRELIGSIRRALVMAESLWISARDLGLDENTKASGPAAERAASRRTIDATRLRATLERNGGNISRTARELELSRMTVYRLIRRHGLGEPASAETGRPWQLREARKATGDTT